MSIKRDYKPTSSWRKRRRLRLHGLLVIALVVIGLFSTLLVYLSRDTSVDVASSDPVIASAESPTSLEPPAPPKPKYDFYNVLPERPLIVPPEEDTETVTDSPPPVAAPQTAETDSRAAELASATPGSPTVSTHTPSKSIYFVQAGSFLSVEDADRRKASIAMLGVPAQIQPFRREDGTILHRVRIGPIDDPMVVENLRQRLDASDIPSIAIRAR